MKRNKVEILALLDRSGSMSGIMPEAVGAFNKFIQDQKDLDVNDKVRVTLAAFDNEYEVVFDRVKLQDVPELTIDMVQPRGMTALLDSIGKLINSAKHPKRDTILLIQTDGAENSSREFNLVQIKELIKSKEGWDVNFIGAGIDAVSVGSSMGFAASKSISVAANAKGMETYGASLSCTTTLYRNAKQIVN